MWWISLLVGCFAKIQRLSEDETLSDSQIFALHLDVCFIRFARNETLYKGVSIL